MPASALLHVLHLFFVVLLFSATFADTFFVRSKQAQVLQPKELLEAWRTRLALLEMFLFTLVVAFGVFLWMPAAASYNPAVFHSKIGLAVVYLALGKARMLRERRTKATAIGLTRAMTFVLTIILCLGIYGGIYR